MIENSAETLIQKSAVCFEKNDWKMGATYLLEAYYESGKSEEILEYFHEIFLKPNLEELERIYHLNLEKVNIESTVEYPKFRDLAYQVIPIDENYFYLLDKVSRDIVTENFTEKQKEIIDLCTNENAWQREILNSTQNLKKQESKVGSNEENIVIINTDEKEISFADENIFNIRMNFVDSIVGKDAPLVSIYVQAYNNLEKYTKTCIECILKYTKDVDYELILVDNGSTDGTFEYFKQVPYYNKKVIRVTKNIGGYEGARHGMANCAGKYIVSIANDLYVTKNWLSNMLKCAMSDARIGIVNPTSDYVSNLQSIDLGYKDFDDMQAKAAKFNVSDPKKWEERMRLITLGTLWKRECLDAVGFIDYGFIHDFADDDISFRIRRAGYKLILCKDVFISHAGKMVDKGAELANQSLLKGRLVFKDKYYGVDAWEDVCNYEYNMVSFFNTNSQKTVYKLLGVDVRCGTPLLEIKNKLKMQSCENIELSAFTTDAKYWLDLSTICDTEVRCDRLIFIREHYQEKMFDAIVCGEQLNKYAEPYKLLDIMLSLLKEDGILIIRIGNDYDVRNFLYNLDQYNLEIEGSQSYIGVQNLASNLEIKGYQVEAIIGEPHLIDTKNKKILEEKLKKITEVNKIKKLMDRLLIKDYLLKIKKK